MRISTGLAALVLCAFVMGCSGTPSGGGSKTGTGLQAMADRLSAGRAQLETTMANLDALVATTEGDPAPAYKAFADSVKALNSRAESVKKASDQIASKSEAYFQQWEEELAAINNEDIRSQSAARRDDVRKALADIQSNYAELGELYTALMADLNDLVAVLKTDLTLAGIKAIESPAKNAQAQATKVLAKAEEVESDFRALGVALSGG